MAAPATGPSGSTSRRTNLPKRDAWWLLVVHALPKACGEYAVGWRCGGDEVETRWRCGTLQVTIVRVQSMCSACIKYV